MSSRHWAVQQLSIQPSETAPSRCCHAWLLIDNIQLNHPSSQLYPLSLEKQRTGKVPVQNIIWMYCMRLIASKYVNVWKCNVCIWIYTYILSYTYTLCKNMCVHKRVWYLLYLASSCHFNWKEETKTAPAKPGDLLPPRLDWSTRPGSSAPVPDTAWICRCLAGRGPKRPSTSEALRAQLALQRGDPSGRPAVEWPTFVN